MLCVPSVDLPPPVSPKLLGISTCPPPFTPSPAAPPTFTQILRVFYDRLVDRKDRAWFLDFMKQTVQVWNGGGECGGLGGTYCPAVILVGPTRPIWLYGVSTPFHTPTLCHASCSPLPPS